MLLHVSFSPSLQDTQWERDLFAADSLPFIRRLSRELGVEFGLCDLRWGINDNMSQAHQTVDICRTEVARCMESTVGINFVALIFDKYGFQPIPVAIPAPEFELIAAEVPAVCSSPDDLKMLTTWFRKDTNTVPAVYRLQPIRSVLPGIDSTDRAVQSAASGTFWGVAFPTVQGALRKAVLSLVAQKRMDEETALKYNISVTEQEVLDGIFSPAKQSGQRVAERALLIRRRLVDIDLYDNDAKRFVDIQAAGSVLEDARHKLSDLRDARLNDVVRADRVRDCTVKWEAEGIEPLKSPAHADHLRDCVNSITAALAESLIEGAKANAYVLPPADQDALIHVSDACNLGKGFVAREDLVARMHALVQAQPVSIIAGPLGSGKAALLSKLAWDLSSPSSSAGGAGAGAGAKPPPPPIIAVRLVGVTPDSLIAASLIKGICQQLHRAAGEQVRHTLDSWDSISSCFATSLRMAKAEAPIVVVRVLL